MTDLSDAALRERARELERLISCGPFYEVCGFNESCKNHQRAADIINALRDAARAEERAKDGPLRSCPWCSEDQRGRIAHRQIDHLIACPAREDQFPTAPSGGGWPQDCEEARADADAVLDMIRQALRTGGCLHGHDDDHPQTPPMLYPEWIACAVAQARAERRERDAAILDALAAKAENAEQRQWGIINGYRYGAAAIRAQEP